MSKYVHKHGALYSTTQACSITAYVQQQIEFRRTEGSSSSLPLAGLKFGMYSDAGEKTCLGYPGEHAG